MTKTIRHNKDGLGGTSFARRENRQGMNTTPLSRMKGRSVTSIPLTNGGRKIVTKALVRAKAKGSNRKKWLPVVTGILRAQGWSRGTTHGRTKCLTFEAFGYSIRTGLLIDTG